MAVTYTIVHKQHWILNQLSEAKDQTCLLKDTSWVRYRCTTTETPTWALIPAKWEPWLWAEVGTDLTPVLTSALW